MTNWNLEGLKPIEEYPGYFCNEQGDVYSTKIHARNPEGRLHKMTPTLNGAGYLHVTLRKDNKSHARVVHRLIAKTWLDNPSNKRTVNHIDGDKTGLKKSGISRVATGHRKTYKGYIWRFTNGK